MHTIFVSHGLLSADFFQYNEWIDIDCPLHCHYTFELVIVLSGTFIIKKEDKIYTLGQNDIMIIMPFERHEFITEGNSHIAVLEISTDFISNYDTIFKNKTLKNPCCKLTENNLSFIYERLKNAGNNSVIELNSIFFTVFSIVLKDNGLIGYNEPDDIFKQAITYVNNHFEENICLKDVAKALNVSYVYLSRVFSKKIMMKFNDFLNSFRLQQAIVLLKNQAVPISEICYSCGFGSLRNFNRVFLKTMQSTPSEFRKKYTNIIE